jgi:predicted translin family RNA/ssDNA-binding protein
MSKQNGSTKFAHSSEAVSRWNEAISDAERMLEEAKQKVARLRRSIKTFQELRDDGEPFPGESQSEVSQ